MPTTAEHIGDDIPEAVIAWIDAGLKVALATVVETWGSAPRPAGAQLAINEDGAFLGSVSGGCVEGAVVCEALDCLQDGRVRMLEYGVSDENAFSAGLACGGTIRIMVEPVGLGQGPDVSLLRELVGLRAARRGVVLAVDTKTWERRLIQPGQGNLQNEAATCLRFDKSVFAGDWFLGVHNPPLRLAIIGAVHIAQPLIAMARLSGYAPTLIDPRTAFASHARFPGEVLNHDWPDQALRRLSPDTRTAVVALSHDPKIDDPALQVALESPAFYIGALGSRKTHARRTARLRALGVPDRAIDRINGPVGLDIGARSPAEIAIAILGEMTTCLRAPDMDDPATGKNNSNQKRNTR